MKAFSLMILVLTTSGSLAQAREYDGGRFQVIQKRIEQLKCKKSPAYCESKKLLDEAEAQLAVSNDLLTSLRRQTIRICEGTAVRRAERSEADGLGMRHTIKTQCSDIAEYVELSSPVVAEIATQTENLLVLQSRVEELRQTVKAQFPVLDSNEYMNAINY